MLEIELHVRRIFLKGIEDFLRRRAQYIVYFVDLVQLVVAGEQRKQGQYLEEDAADSPDVHLVPVMPVSHQALRRSVPSGRNILRQWRFTIQAAATAQIGQFNRVAG